MASHAAGGGIGVIILVLCVVKAVLTGDALAIISAVVYGVSVVVLYTMSAVYHGLHSGTAKKVMQVLDHCTIYYLIAGSYTPIMLTRVLDVSPTVAVINLSLVWGLLILATVFTAIDLKKYSVFSYICYIVMGWSIILFWKVLLKAIPYSAALWLLAGGIMYTVGAVFYAFGSKKRYIHSVFHLFCVLGTVLQFICIFFYCL
jgi:hemolysin III